jgi:hypothetical protein
VLAIIERALRHLRNITTIGPSAPRSVRPIRRSRKRGVRMFEISTLVIRMKSQNSGVRRRR